MFLKFLIAIWLVITPVYAGTLPLLGAGGPTSSSPPSSAQVPGPSTTLFNSPYYSCVRNFYVATTGLDSRTTTQAQNSGTPWLTIGKYNSAIGTSAAGDCINVASGTYSTGVSVTKGGTTASSTGYVVYRCQTLNGCTVTDPGNNSFNAAFGFQANYVMVDGFTLNGGNGTGVNTVGFGTCNVDPCSGVTNTLGHHHIWLINNIISGYGQAGAQMNNGEYFYSIHNSWFNNSHDGQAAQGSGISYFLPIGISGYTPTADDQNNSVTGNTGTNFRQFVMWNVFYNNYIQQSGTSNTDGSGFIADDWQGDQFNSPTGNTVYTNGGLIAFNVSYNNGSNGIHSFDSAYLTIANNSAFNNFLDTHQTQTFRGNIDDNGSYGNSYINNISYGGCGAGILANNSAMLVAGLNGYTANTTLNGTITAGATSLVATSNVKFPSGSTFNSTTQQFSGRYTLPGGNMIQIGSEILLVTAGWGTNTWTVQRGYNGTTAASHTTGATIQWIQEYYSNNVTFSKSPCTDVDFEGSSTANLFYSATANLETTNPLWTNVGNTSFGTITTQPNGVNFALSGSSSAINFGSITSPFNFLPSTAVDAGACSSTLTTCP